MVKDMMDAWIPQQRDLGPRNGHWSLTSKQFFLTQIGQVFFFSSRKLPKQYKRHSGQRIPVERSGCKTWLGHCVVFLDKTLYSPHASLHPGVYMGTSELS